jgi:hypothetical protein
VRKISVQFDRHWIPGSELCKLTTVINGIIVGDQTFVTAEAASFYEEMVLLLFDPDAKDEEEAK